jgi:Flp pilus assembly protein TadD
MTERYAWAVVLVACAVGACAGGTASERPPDAPLPDEAVPPARAVPPASDLVKEGEAKLQADDAAGARVLFEQAIAADASDARAHLDLGIALEMQDEVAEAEKAYRRAVELQPDLAEALNNLAVLVRLRGEGEEAIGLLRRATGANPGSASAHANLALALEDAGDLAGAEGAYRKALSIQADDAITRANLGLLLLKRERPEDAARELKEALPRAAGNRAVLLAIGNGLRRAGDTAAAVRAMQGAVDAGEAPTPALLAELALAQRAAGDRAAAIASIERALALDDRYATGHYLLGNMLAGDGRAADARVHYKRYLKIEPKGEHADKVKERLKMLDRAK